MSHTEYKGFNVTENNSRFFVSSCGGYPVEGINPEGYATLNTAKGAITKYLKASEEAQAKAAEVAASLPYPVDSLPGNTVLAYGDGVVITVADFTKIKDRITEYVTGEPLPSRRKREGGKFVKIGGRLVRSPYSDKMDAEPLNRKQRNARKMDERAYAREIGLAP